MKTKTTKITGILLTLVMLVTMIGAFTITASAADPTLTTDQYDVTGDGVKDSVYEIRTVADLQWFCNKIYRNTDNLNAILLNDLDLSTVCSETLGSWDAVSMAYLGVFDGNGHTIKNLYINVEDEYQGLFGSLYNGTIKNLTVTGSVSATKTAAGFVGNGSCNIINCVNYVNVTISDFNGAGFIGYQGSSSVVDGCVNYGSITHTGTGTATISGIVGRYYGTVRNCTNFGKISSANGLLAAGIAGQGYYTDTLVENCVNYGVVSDARGLASEITHDGTEVKNCYYNASSTNVAVYKYAETTVTNVVAVSETELSDGSLAYDLGEGWGQEIGVDAAPVPGGMKVYRYLSSDTLCSNVDTATYVYSNSATYNGGEIVHDNTLGAEAFTNGFCTVCDAYEQPTLNADGYYEIDNAGKLYWFAERVNGGKYSINGKLTANIVVNQNVLNADGTLNGTPARVWTPIGTYTGTFDGGEYTVSGLYYNGSDRYAGLFSIVNKEGTVQNLGIIDSYSYNNNTDGRDAYFGGVVGRNYGTVQNCSNAGTIVGDSKLVIVGGVVGDNQGTVKDCFNSGTVSGTYHVGGVVGDNAGTVEDCSNSGTVSGNTGGTSADCNVGGVVGRNYMGTVQNCSNAGTVGGSGLTTAGGVVGNNWEGEVLDCYNTGTVRDGWELGGVAGHNTGTVEDCSNSGSVNYGSATRYSSSGSFSYAGGVVGFNSGPVRNCSNSGTVTPVDTADTAYNCFAGGVVGDNHGTVQNCSNSGDVSGEAGYCYVGGVVGRSNSTVQNSFNSGDVSGHSTVYLLVGGVAGQNNSGTVQDCYNRGTVIGTGTRRRVGGVVGQNDGGTVQNCYYLTGTAAGGINGADVDGQAEVRTAEQFASGEVAYLLNGDQSTITFKQTIGTADYPGFTGDQVYYGYLSCAGDATKVYTNDSKASATRPAHTLTYTANSSTVNAVCSANDCGYSGSVTIKAEGKIYDGTPVTATLDGSIERVDTPEIIYTGNTNAGTYTASITFDDATASVDFTITKATPTESDFTFTLSTDLTYNGEDKAVTVTAKDSIVGMGTITVKYYDAEGSLLNGAPVNAGTYTVKVDVAEGDNYKAATEIEIDSFIISPFTLGEGHIVMDPGENTYNGSKQQPEITVMVDGKTLVLDVDYKLTWDIDGFVNADTYTATIEGIGNYQGTVNKSYVINPKPLVDSNVTIDITEATYDGSAHTPVITVKDGEKTLLEETDYEITWNKSGFVNADTYTATITGKGNYSGSFTRTLVIKQAELEIELTSPITSVLPGNQIALTLNTNSDAIPAWTITGGTLESGTTVAINNALVIGQDKVTITVTYVETNNVKGGSKTITLEVGMADFSGEIADLEEKINDLGETYATDAELKVELDALKEAINNLKAADTATAEDISDINEKIESIKTTYAAKTDLDAAVARLDELTKNGGTIDQINAAIEDINEALTDLDAENRLDAAETSLNTLLSTTIPTLNDLISENSTAIGTNASEIATLKTTVSGIQTTLTSLDTEDERLAGLISGLDTELDGLAGALNTLAERVTATEQEIDLLQKDLNAQYTELVDLINANTLDIGAINTTLANIETTLTTLATKTDVTKEVNTLTGLINTLTARVTDNEADISANAGEISTLKSTVEALATELRGADETLTNSVNGLSSALSALTGRVDTAEKDIAQIKQNLADAINTLNKDIADGDKLNSDALIKAIDDLTALIEAAEKKASDADVALKSELEQAIADANTAITKAYEKAISDAVADLELADKANSDALAEAIKNLEALIDVAEEAAIAGDNTLSGKITEAITKAETELKTAKENLEALIGGVQSNLDNAKAKLEKAIADLDAAMKKGDADLSTEIADLNTALTNAKAALEKADADNKTELEGKITDAQTTLQSAIDKVAKDLADAEKELADAIASGDAELGSSISSVSASLSAAKTALEKADADNKAELIAKIEAAEATLDAAIKVVQKNLDDAKTALEKALADGDKANADALAQAISDLNAAIDAAETAAATADGSLKTELTSKIDNADAALQAAIDTLSIDLDATNKKVDQLEIFIIIVCVISGVALCGSGAFVVWFFIDRKKRI